jgi:Podovirus DNA encapsidation protein (Gp16).
MKKKFYNLGRILSYKADYNVIFGKRSNGKTFSVKEVILFGYHDKNWVLISMVILMMNLLVQ